jgi:bifunctional DNA-binding transcriptional regulator/antitoxin component of YhaV-PrlF toxin-antitoxin module
MVTTTTSAYAKPTQGTKTGRVWEIADKISRESGRLAQRKQVVDAYVAEGGNPNTASTQYAYWKLSRNESALKLGQSIPGSTEKFNLQVAQDGRLLIPAEMREAMLISDASTLTARVENGELRLISPKVALLRIQQLIKRMDKGKDSAVDELIAERKAEAQVE